MPSTLPVSSAFSDIRRRGEFIEHPLDASALGCASCVRFAPHSGRSGSPCGCLKASRQLCSGYDYRECPIRGGLSTLVSRHLRKYVHHHDTSYYQSHTQHGGSIKFLSLENPGHGCDQNYADA